jgi:hypothetical protein
LPKEVQRLLDEDPQERVLQDLEKRFPPATPLDDI